MYGLKVIKTLIRTPIILSILLIFLFLTVGVYSSSEKQKKDKRVIEFGWDIPDTEFVKNNISKMEETPFNGVVIHVKYRGDGSKTENYIEWIGFGGEYLEYNDEVKIAITN